MRESWKGPVERAGLVLGAVALLASPSAAWPGEKVEVRYLAQGKKVIPVFCSIGHWQITDIKLPELAVTNHRRVPMTLARVEVIGRVAEEDALRLQITGDSLSAVIRDTAVWLNSPTTLPEAVRIEFGNVVRPEGRLSESGKIAPGQSLVLPLSKVAYLHHVGDEKIDRVEIRLTLKSGADKVVKTFPVQLTPYESKGGYIFPVRGDIQMAYLPLSYIHHRASASQEFAMDVVGAHQPDGYSFISECNSNPVTLGDFGVWHRDVLAMGDGVVVEVGNNFPEAEMSDPQKFMDPDYVEALLRRLIPSIGFTNAIAGNHVVVDHENGEFSIYCHLSEGTIGVAVGERVRRGQVIAKVGNTGNSGGPHLHFQLMDSPDFMTANGLPVTFEDVPVQVMVNGNTVEANTLSFSDSLFQAVD